MAKKRFSPEQIVAQLRQIEVLTAGGKALPQACKESGITDVTYYRWRKENGGLKAGQGACVQRALRHRLDRLLTACGRKPLTSEPPLCPVPTMQRLRVSSMAMERSLRTPAKCGRTSSAA